MKKSKLNKKRERKIHDLLHYLPQIKRRNCTLKKKEDEELIVKAAEAGYQPTPYLKVAALAYIRSEVIVSKHDEEAYRQMKWEVKRVGNLLNQMIPIMRTNPFLLRAFNAIKAKRQWEELTERFENIILNRKKRK